MALAIHEGLRHPGRHSHGVLRRAFDRMVTAREREARRYVTGYLLSLDDATLATYGYDRDSLEKERSALMPF